MITRIFFTDPLVLRASELLLRRVVSRFKDHPAIGLWNLGEVIKRFAAPQPKVQPPQRPVILDLSPELYYQAPLHHAKHLYQAFLES